MKLLNFLTSIFLVFFTTHNHTHAHVLSAKCPFTKEVCDTCEEFGVLSNNCIDSIEKECCYNDKGCEDFSCNDNDNGISLLTKRKLSTGASGPEDCEDCNEDDVIVSVSVSTKYNPDMVNGFISASIPTILYYIN